MLEPTSRALFTDALRPPSGYTVDLAVGSTYTLSLPMILLPPLAMAAHDRESDLFREDSAPQVDTLALLESVRRFADRTTIYCHAGGIRAPDEYPRLLTFAEDSVVQVLPRRPSHIFHPKVWALRFRQDTSVVHRLVVGSRNLTDDTSWDTLLVLDQGESGSGIDGSPAAEFVRTLPSLAKGPVASGRPEQANDLAATLSRTWFQPPAPFTSGAMWPLGIGLDAVWPMPERPHRALVISPFLDAPTVARVDARSRPVFVSRPDSYAMVGGRAFDGADVRVLSPHAESGLSTEPETEPSRRSEVRTGLHAKVLVWDEGSNGHLFTGSANATNAAFTGNVEFGVLLTGPRRSCGVEALLPPGDASRDRITFGQILTPHTILDPDPQPDPNFRAGQMIEDFHAQLLKAGPVLSVDKESDDLFTLTLSFSRPIPASPGCSRVRLISRSRTDRVKTGVATWTGVQLLQLTPYLEFVTSAAITDSAEPLELACVLKAELIGAPEERAAMVLRSYLGSEESVVRYLRFLLDEADSGSLWDELDPSTDDSSTRGPTGAPAFEDLAIMEPLLRAAAQGSESLDRVQALLRDLGVDRDEADVVPAEFLHMWEAVWTASQRERDR